MSSACPPERCCAGSSVATSRRFVCPAASCASLGASSTRRSSSGRPRPGVSSCQSTKEENHDRGAADRRPDAGIRAAHGGRAVREPVGRAEGLLGGACDSHGGASPRPRNRLLEGRVMQTGSVLRCGRGWRGYWRENGKRRGTATFARKGEARAALNRELDRIALGDAYMAPITLRELADRWLAQYDRAPKTVKCAKGRLVRVLEAFGDAQAGDLTTETLQAWLARQPAEKVGKAYRRDIVRTLRL